MHVRDQKRSGAYGICQSGLETGTAWKRVRSSVGKAVHAIKSITIVVSYVPVSHSPYIIQLSEAAHGGGIEWSANIHDHRIKGINYRRMVPEASMPGGGGWLGCAIEAAGTLGAVGP
jgi:hypothetical protein